MKAILLDIEGTTTTIDFVHETLFSYSKEKMSGFLSENPGGLKTEIGELKKKYAIDFAEQLYGRRLDENEPVTIANYLRFLIDTGSSSSFLTSVQERIWLQGYESGELETVVFEDVLPAFERWKKEEIEVAIFSSMSVSVQKTLFGHTDHGDLTVFIDEYFDSSSGAKNEPESYKKITEILGFAPDEIVFISDSTDELDAARKAGLRTILSLRKGNAPITGDATHQIVENFDEIH